MPAEPVEANVGTLLRAWRERALLTQEELAERAGVSVRTVRRLESGAVRRPQVTSLRLVGTALGLDDAEQRALAAAARGTPAGVVGDGPGSAGADPSDVPHQLPAAPPAFTGRAAELADLDGLREPGTVVISAIDGMAGIGKTALAVHAAHRAAPHYPDGQLFLDLHGHTEGIPPVAPHDALDRVLRALGVPGEAIPRHPEDRAALYRTRLADRRMVILLDNAADEEQVGPLLPGAPGCLVILTSRRRLAGLDHVHPLSLDVLPRPDAIALFAATAGEHRVDGHPPGTVVEIVELCGRLPLALRIAAARLRSRPSWTPAHLVERLRGQRDRLAELEAGRRSVAAALDLSYLQLGSAGRRAYRLLGLHPGADFDAYSAAALIGTTLQGAERLVRDLVDVHLLQEPTAGRYRFHDLVREHAVAVGNRDGGEPAREALTRLLDGYFHTAALAAEAVHPAEHARRDPPPATTPAPAVSDPERAAAWLEAELPNLLAAARYAADHGRPGDIRRLSAALARYVRLRARYGDAEDLHGRALAAARAAGDDAGAAEALADLAFVHRMQGRLDEAFTGFTQALALAEAAGQTDVQREVLTALGHIHQVQGRHGQAVEVYRRAVGIARAGGHRTGEMAALNGLGFVHWLRGEHEQASVSFTTVLEIARATGNRVRELDALNGLGWYHRQQGRLEDALPCFERALDTARAVGNPVGELSAMSGLAGILRSQGRHEQALAGFQDVLDLAGRIRNPNWEFEGRYGIGRVHQALGRPETALGHHGQALELATRLGQPGDEARAHDGLARAHDALDHPEQARAHWRAALEILVALGTEHTEDDDATTTEAIREHLRRLDRRLGT